MAAGVMLCAGTAFAAPVRSSASAPQTRPPLRAVAHSTAAAPPATISEYPLPAHDRQPAAITAGPAGDLWFTEAIDGLGIRSPSGSIGELLGLSGPASGIAQGPDGNLWVTEPGANVVARVTPSGGITQFSRGLTANSLPTAITSGPDGNLWFTESGHSGRIGRITPSGAITEFSAGLTPNSLPTAITSGPDGNLWFTESGNPGRIGRITPSGAITEEATPNVNSRPNAITAVSDGSLWFTEDGNHGALGHAMPTANPPAATTSPATYVAPTSVSLAGVASPNGVASTYHFDWGATVAYGQRAPAADAALGAGSSPQPVVQTVGGLLGGTTYHYRLVVSNCGGCQAGTSYGADMTFTTTSSPTLTIGPSDPVLPPAPPVLRRSAVTAVLSGKVLVKVPGSSVLQPLHASRNIPMGSLIDADDGTVRVTTALNRAGQTQSASVWGGSFVLNQTAQRGMTTFTVAGRLTCPARRSHADVATMLAGAHPKKHPHTATPSLWAHDNNGQYSTRGNNSVATVRGTWWETVNTCSGTLTRVRKGLVSVRNLRRHRTVLVRAGHSYLARG
jgi:streptogramin lyase